MTVLWENIILTALFILAPLALIAGGIVWLMMGKSRRKR